MHKKQQHETYKLKSGTENRKPKPKTRKTRKNRKNPKKTRKIQTNEIMTTYFRGYGWAPILSSC
jgi:hypothetical protein